MHNSVADPAIYWPLWRKCIFRFFCILLIFLITPWSWLNVVPGINYINDLYDKLVDWAVEKANTLLFHIAPQLIYPNGSGDTSYGWAYLWFAVLLAATGSVVWSVLDRKRRNYVHLNYWLCLFARYFVAKEAILYGILKIFALQMAFPNMHQLATPLGDLLPMRFSWFFIGYSTPYQVFSGIMELVTGLLLLKRSTSTLGIMLAAAVFTNVAMLNLSYDIPVKIFSLQLAFTALFLLANESTRIIAFFILNKPAAAGELYHFRYAKKGMRITRWVLKAAFIIIAVIMPFIDSYDYYKVVHQPPKNQPVRNGVYAVQVFAVNHDTLAASRPDSLRWQELIFENGIGSLRTTDTIFRHRYNRAYFNYALDSASQMLGFKKLPADSVYILKFRFSLPDSNTVRLWGKQSHDSLYIELKRTARHFQLAEKQFHWLSEANR